MADNFTVSQDSTPETKGLRSAVIVRRQPGGLDPDSGKDGEAAGATIPPKKPVAARIRHRVSGTNRRARSA